jgi:NADPH:quinone reductase-like Zn-dependent oxidoreductase
VRSAEERAEVCAALIPEVLPAVAAGRLKPVIDTVFRFEEAQRAAERMRSNEAVGKLVLELA